MKQYTVEIESWQVARLYTLAYGPDVTKDLVMAKGDYDDGDVERLVHFALSLSTSTLQALMNEGLFEHPPLAN